MFCQFSSPTTRIPRNIHKNGNWRIEAELRRKISNFSSSIAKNVMRCEAKWNIFISSKQKPQFSLSLWKMNESIRRREREENPVVILENSNQLAIE